MGFEPRVVAGERAWERRRRKSTVLELVVCVKRDVGVLLLPVCDGLREMQTESEELSQVKLRLRLKSVAVAAGRRMRSQAKS